MKNLIKIVLIYFSILFLFLSCSGNNVGNIEDFLDEANFDLSKISIDEEAIEQAYRNSKGKDFNINLQIEDVDKSFIKSIDDIDSFINLIKKYKYLINENETDYNYDSIKNIVSINPENSSHIKIQSNSLYVFGEGQYYIDFIYENEIENVIIIGKGADKTLLVGAIGIFDSNDIVFSHLAMYYEKNEKLTYSSIAFINSINIIIDNIWIDNSLNGIEFGNSSAKLKNLISINNHDTNIYVYNNSTLNIYDSLISSSIYNGIYVEDSIIEISNSTIKKNGFAGIYSRYSNLEIANTNFIENRQYGIQLKFSNLKLYNSNFERENKSFDYNGDVYVNPFSNYETNIPNNEINFINTKEIIANTQNELDEAMKYAEINDNVNIIVGEGNYLVEKIITNRNDIFIIGSKEGNTDFVGYMAFSSCFDTELKNIDLKFSGNAFNGIEIKNCYCTNFDNVRIKSAKQNGIQIDNSIVSMSNFYTLNSLSAGLVAIDSKIDISDSFFEQNEISGISTINSDLILDNVILRNNKSQSGITLINSYVEINNSIFENNGITGISSEKSILNINNSKLNSNGSSGIEIASSNVKIYDTELSNNLDYGMIIYKNSELEASSLYISGNSIGGIFIKGESDVLFKDIEIRKSTSYGIYIKNNFSFNNSSSNNDGTWPDSVKTKFKNISISYVKNGFYSESSYSHIDGLKLSNIGETAITLIDNSFLQGLNIEYGSNIGTQMDIDRTSIYTNN